MMKAVHPSPKFVELLAGGADLIELDEAALHVAAMENPALDFDAARRTLDDWAAVIGAKLPPSAGGAQYLSVAHEVLFGDLELRGDTEDYFHPCNSCLDQVMERRRGLPITLSVVYLEVARRLLRPVFGVPLPAHFICRYNDGLVNVFVDVFHGGRLMSSQDCIELVEEITGRRIPDTPLTFAAATKRQIILRMLTNLKSAYQRAGRERDAARVEKVLRVALT